MWGAYVFREPIKDYNASMAGEKGTCSSWEAAGGGSRRGREGGGEVKAIL